MEKLVIGAWQGVCTDGDLEANLARTERVIDEAADAGCDFVCLPELFLSGTGSRKIMVESAIALDDPRLTALAEHAGRRGVVTLVGLTEKRGDRYAVTQAILDEGRVAGHYTKTMPTEADWELMRFYDDELPVFASRGVTFGIIICHDSSFPEVAATLAWKGARIIFSPHYNWIDRQRMDDHRIRVRNNHVGIASHYGVVVVRSNVVGHWPANDCFGYGDSAIFGPNGVPLVEAGLFTERLITADVAASLRAADAWRQRGELRPAIIRRMSDAALEALNAQREHRHDA
ncbi:MAG TPA: carbon-nitrogen hydrolase family protein [Planctomycetota bacterium]|nr:carbon-nitrogen hydrolase family protein [Planctomycetota bacterium]